MHRPLTSTYNVKMLFWTLFQVSCIEKWFVWWCVSVSLAYCSDRTETVILFFSSLLFPPPTPNRCSDDTEAEPTRVSGWWIELCMKTPTWSQTSLWVDSTESPSKLFELKKKDIFLLQIVYMFVPYTCKAWSSGWRSCDDSLNFNIQQHSNKRALNVDFGRHSGTTTTLKNKPKHKSSSKISYVYSMFNHFHRTHVDR